MEWSDERLAVESPRRCATSTLTTYRRWIVVALVGTMAALGTACERAARAPVVVLASTTSFGHSGLLERLTPAFERAAGVRIRGYLVGSGLALRMLERGQADVVISHAPEMEARFLERNPGWSYRKVAYNHFLWVGPDGDPAGVRGAPTVNAVVRRLVERGAVVVSRGDESGTHARERRLWAQAGVSPTADRVIVTGQGMSRTLRVASEVGAYTLTDVATFERMRQALDLEPVFDQDAALLNTYAVMTGGASERSNGSDGGDAPDGARGALELARWLADGDGRGIIAAFRVSPDVAGFTVWPEDAPRDHPGALPY